VEEEEAMEVEVAVGDAAAAQAEEACAAADTVG